MTFAMKPPGTYVMPFSGSDLGIISVNNNNRWITTVAARFGRAIDHWMIYGKAGGAWVGSNNFNISSTTGLFLNCGTFGFSNCNNNTGGWVAGVGFEYAFTNNWKVKAEYDYIGLGNRTFFVPTGIASPFAGDVFTTNNRNVQMVKVGFNYLFNWGAPVAARY
jgi:outer membrane immunogenic protein